MLYSGTHMATVSLKGLTDIGLCRRCVRLVHCASVYLWSGRVVQGILYAIYCYFTGFQGLWHRTVAIRRRAVARSVQLQTEIQ